MSKKIMYSIIGLANISFGVDDLLKANYLWGSVGVLLGLSLMFILIKENS